MFHAPFFRSQCRAGKMAAACAAVLSFASGVTVVRAAEGFSDALDKADYAAAGLEKLSDTERVRLDELVKTYAAGKYNPAAAQIAPPPAPPPSAAVAAAPESVSSAATTPAAPSPAPKPKKQKVKIDPGTEIEYTTMETELAGTFAGFEKGTVFTLANGQRWKVIDGSYVCGPDPRVKKVRVKPGIFGSFFLEFEKVGTRAKVQLVK